MDNDSEGEFGESNFIRARYIHLRTHALGKGCPRALNLERVDRKLKRQPLSGKIFCPASYEPKEIS